MESVQKLKASEFGLEESKAAEISEMFKPMLDKMSELEGEYNELIKGDITPSLCKKAGDLRKKYVKVRTGTAKIHKDLKAFYLNGGRFVDGWKNTQLTASGKIEETLKNIEEHYENEEKERIKSLFDERSKKLEEFNLSVIPGDLGHMAEDVWENFYKGTEENYKAIKAAEEKAAREKEEEQRRAKEERERERKENERLRKEKAAAEKEAAEAKAKLEAETKAKEEAEKKAKEIEEKQAVEHVGAKVEAVEVVYSGDNDKMNALKTDLEALVSKYSFEGEEYIETMETVKGILEQTEIYIYERHG